MNPKLRMLVWKEWRERKTQFLICSLWMVGGAVYCVAYEMTHRFRAPVASFHTVASVYGMFLPIFLAMRTSLGEITDRTRSVSDALPVSVRTRGWIRWAGGASVLIVPILIGALILAVCLATGLVEQVAARQAVGSGQLKFMERPPLEFLAAMKMLTTIAMVSGAAGLMTYGILALVGTWLKYESHLGFVGVVVVALTFLGNAIGTRRDTAAVWENVGTACALLFPEGTIISWGYAEQTGSYTDPEFVGRPHVIVIASLIFQLAIAAYFVRRNASQFGRRLVPEVPHVRRVFWRIPGPWFRKPSFALIWLTLRVSIPMCMTGFLLATLMTLLIVRVGYSSTVAGRYTDAMSNAMWIVGVLWAVVVGSGSFSADIDRRIAEFWRALPISVVRFYAVKFMIGLSATLILLDGLVIALTWNAPNWGDRHSMNWSYIACIPLLHAAMFSIAVAWTCYLRRPVVGGMAALMSFLFLTMGLEWFAATREYDPISVYNNLLNFVEKDNPAIDLTSAGYPIVAALMMLTIAVAAIVGYAGLRRYRSVA